ncbi:MAG: shikimate dehydrogenase family protein [Anaeroplasma sp.]
MRKYALIGAKLSHSFSPIIHKEIMNDMNVDGSYELLECKPFELEGIINKLRTGEYSGFNVTIPYKKEVIKYIDELSTECQKIGSVNTISLVDGKIVGYNTDYYGFYQELIHFKVEVKDKNCFVLGNGGASLAICQVLKDLGGNVTVVSRTPSDNMISYEDLIEKSIDVLVNTTPVGMYPNINDSPVNEGIVIKADYVIDIIFNPRITKFLSYANSHMDGLYMLVGQAIKAEEIWQQRNYNGELNYLVKRIEEKVNE